MTNGHSYTSFTWAYHELLKDVYWSPTFVSSPRGMKIRETLGVQFRLSNPRNRLPFLNERGYSAEYLIAESIWYLSGDNTTSWIAKYASFWNQISDDGVTANSAYGARIFRPHARLGGMIDERWTQWQYVIDELKADNDSRRAVIHIRSPYDSILAKKDVPCTVSLQFFLRHDQVHLHVNMRSSDLILGLPYDVPAFTLFQELMAIELTRELARPIGLGEYVHTSASLHVYERHFEMVERILNDEANKRTWDTSVNPPMPPMPGLPPIPALLSFESKVWAARVPNEVRQVHVERQSINPYWDDWFTLLSCKRLANLGDAQGANELLRSTYYKGYQFFARK